MRDRIAFFSTLCSLPLLLLGSCGTSDHDPELPTQDTYPVRYSLDLMGDGYRLHEPYTMMEISERRRVTDRLGVGGLLVVHIPGVDQEGSDSFEAFDLACPYEWPSVVRVKVKKEGTTEVVCPVCETVYDLSMGVGLPKTGKSRFPLWKYRTTLRGNYLEITNR